MLVTVPNSFLGNARSIMNLGMDNMVCKENGWYCISMIKMRRIIAFVLVAVLLSSVCLTASSCKKRGTKKKTVLETDPFYTTKRIELDPKLNEKDFYDFSVCTFQSGVNSQLLSLFARPEDRGYFS